MAWFRTPKGRLVNGEGGLAQVYVDRGYRELTEKQAAAQLKTARKRAAADAAASKKADDTVRRQSAAKQAQAKRARARELAAAVRVRADVAADKPPTSAESKAVDQAVKDETTGR